MKNLAYNNFEIHFLLKCHILERKTTKPLFSPFLCDPSTIPPPLEKKPARKINQNKSKTQTMTNEFPQKYPRVPVN